VRRLVKEPLLRGAVPTLLALAFALTTIAPSIAQEAKESPPTQVVPTPDATSISLQKDKLVEEIEQLRHKNQPTVGIWFGENASAVVTGAVGLIVGIFGLLRWFTDRRAERDRRAEDRFKSVVESLGSDLQATRVGAAVTLRSFLHPGYERFYSQVFNLAVANLRLEGQGLDVPQSAQLASRAYRTLINRRLRETEPVPSGAGSATDAARSPLVQALATVFQEAYPLARDHQHVVSTSPTTAAGSDRPRAPRPSRRDGGESRLHVPPQS
jgi:hypothetical protein